MASTSATRIDRNANSLGRSRRNFQRLAFATAHTNIGVNGSSTNALIGTSTGYGVFVDGSTLVLSGSTIGVQLNSTGGLSTSPTGIGINPVSTGGISTNSTGVGLLLLSTGGLSTNSTGLWNQGFQQLPNPTNSLPTLASYIQGNWYDTSISTNFAGLVSDGTNIIAGSYVYGVFPFIGLANVVASTSPLTIPFYQFTIPANFLMSRLRIFNFRFVVVVNNIVGSNPFVFTMNLGSTTVMTVSTLAANGTANLLFDIDMQTAGSNPAGIQTYGSIFSNNPNIFVTSAQPIQQGSVNSSTALLLNFQVQSSSTNGTNTFGINNLRTTLIG